jgi:hypothetical protein
MLIYVHLIYYNIIYILDEHKHIKIILFELNIFYKSNV